MVLKLHSWTITHKTDVGGVQLNLTDAEAVRRAYRAIEQSVRRRVGAEHFLGVTVQPMIQLDGYELIIGSSPDPQFGPVLLFGAGGQLVELLKDRALALPPLNTTLARRMMERTRIFQALKGIRGRRPVDLGALERLLVRFSRLVVEQPRIKEIDINPLLAAPERLIALDARVVLHGAEVDADRLPRPAIRPYPTQYVAPWTAKNGLTVTIRPIRPEDEPLLVRFHEKLSEDTVYLRFFQSLKLSRRIAHERLTRICFIDYDREMALVADYKDPQTGEHEIIAMGRLSRLYGTDEAEFSLEVRDGFQRRGLGTEILRRLVAIGRDEQIALHQRRDLAAKPRHAADLREARLPHPLRGVRSFDARQAGTRRHGEVSLRVARKPGTGGRSGTTQQRYKSFHRGAKRGRVRSSGSETGTVEQTGTRLVPRLGWPALRTNGVLQPQLARRPLNPLVFAERSAPLDAYPHAPNSFALSGAFTRSVQSTGRSTGQGDKMALIASSPCILAHRPLQRNPAA